MKKEEAGKRIYHAYTCGIVGFASVAYLFMALGMAKNSTIFLPGRIQSNLLLL